MSDRPSRQRRLPRGATFNTGSPFIPATRAAHDARVARERRLLQGAETKRKQIAGLENSVRGFHKQREELTRHALAAKKAGRTRDAVTYMRKINRLKVRIEQYENSIVSHTKQLEAYEDLVFQSQLNSRNEEFASDAGEIRQTVRDVEQTLDSVRESFNNVDEINRTVNADAEQDQGLYGEEVMLDALDELEDKYASARSAAVAAASSVPVVQPTMPSAEQAEEDEIARMERDLKALEMSDRIPLL